MSEAISKIDPVLVEDRRLGWNGESKFGVIKSGTQNTFVRLTTNNFSNANIVFNAQPPNQKTAVSREIWVETTFDLAFTGTAGANDLLLSPGLYDAPRFMPLAQCTNTINATINNASVSQNNYQVVNALFRTNIWDQDYKTDLSVFPSMPDFYQNYDDNYVNGWGVANDPLQAIGQTSQGWQTRGGWDYTVLTNTATTATVRFTTYEPLILSPFLNSNDDHKAFIGVQTLQIQINLINLSRVWSHSNGDGNAGTITSLVCNLTVPPALHLNFITPSRIEELPAVINYSYNSLTPYITNGGSVAAGAVNTMTCQNIQLNTIPRRIYVFLRRTDIQQTFATTDTFANIQSLNVTFDNQTGIFAGASEMQLYQMSKNSGLNMSWQQWHKYTGSVMVIDVGRSLMLSNEADAPSLTTSKQLQVQVTYKNLNTVDAVTYDMFVLVISDGLMTINNGSTFLQDSVLSPADIIRAKESGHVEQWERSNNFYGSGFFKGIKNAIKHVGNNIHRGLENSHLLSTALIPFSPGAAVAANLAGYGRSHHASGGRRMSKSQMRY
jgi:hypothetical protein